MGIPLSNIVDIRILYGVPPHGTCPIDFEFKNPDSMQIQRRPTPKGHVIATRITAENPAAGFKPNSGKFMELNFKSNSNVWGYFSVNAAGGVHEYADSQFGHLFAYGESREEARKNIIMALKEISIRGDFRTTVEYLVTLLEHQVFESNSFTTSWLDALIKENADAEEVGTVDDLVPALCGAVSKAAFEFRSGSEAFLNAIQRGKVPTEEFLKTRFVVDFILNNVQYKLHVNICGPESYTVAFKDSKVEINAKPLPDDGLLIFFDGKSHVVYIKEEAGSTSLMVDGSTFVLEKDHDPSQLRSPSPGKLVRYMVKDGDHVNAGDAYAEIEVMKMYMPLVTKVAGIFTGTRLVSSILSNGDVIGVLKLDDISSVKRATPFSGALPVFLAIDPAEKPNHKLRRLSGLVDNILLGYEPSGSLPNLFTDFVVALNNEELPAHEFAEVLGSIASRIPSQLAEFLYSTSTESRKNGTTLDLSVVESEIQMTLAGLHLDEQDDVSVILAPLIDVIDRYREGVTSRARFVLLNLLINYYKLESLYEGTTHPRVLLGLRETHKNDLSFVRDIARATSKPKIRAEFIIHVLDYFGKESDPVLQKFSTDSISSLAHLTGTGASQVSFRAREILIGFQSPSISQRRDAILSIFEKVVKKKGLQFFFNFSQLSRTISSRYSMLDILPELFFHDQMHTRAIALYTYIMRTNQAYTVTSFDHHFLDESVVLSWDFENQHQSLFQPLHDPLVSPLSSPEQRRKGIIFTCAKLDDLVAQVQAVRPLLDLPEEDLNQDNFSFLATVAIKEDENLSTDEGAAKTLSEYVDQHRDFLKKYKIRRATFMVLVPNAHSRYFTFKASLDYAEDMTIRHIEPFMAHRLEMQRLSNFDFKPCLVGNRGVRIYHATGKTNSTDVRFFVRGIIHPANVATFHDFFISEGNRITTGILDTLELLNVSHPNTDCNHILLHFIPVFNLTSDHVRFCLDQLLRRHRSRLSKLRVTEVEICYTGYHPETKEVIPFRFIASIQSQYVIDITWYNQRKSESGEDVLVSVSAPFGPLHGQSVYQPHAPKQFIQPKRYRAHLLGTTYVYDFPALFAEAVKVEWAKLKQTVRPPKMECKELILNSIGELEETSRAPGKFE
jgi:acetyl-CoA carboxylase/biotin carboxylase 1